MQIIKGTSASRFRLYNDMATICFSKAGLTVSFITSILSLLSLVERTTHTKAHSTPISLTILFFQIIFILFSLSLMTKIRIYVFNFFKTIIYKHYFKKIKRQLTDIEWFQYQQDYSIALSKDNTWFFSCQPTYLMPYGTQISEHMLYCYKINGELCELEVIIDLSKFKRNSDTEIMIKGLKHNNICDKFFDIDEHNEHMPFINNLIRQRTIDDILRNM